MRLFCTLLVVALALTGCTSSEPIRVNYTSSTNETVYQTSEMRMKTNDYDARSSQRPQFVAQVEGDCSGIECQPGRYDMKISVSSPVRVDIGIQEMILRVDGKKMTWDGPFDLRTGQGFSPHMRSFSVPLKPDEVRTLARAEDVEMFLGSTSFTIPYDRREPLRALLKRLEANEQMKESM